MIIKVFFETLCPALLAALASDLLYLFLKGAWIEPTLWIAISELVALQLCIVLGIWGVYHSIKANQKER